MMFRKSALKHLQEKRVAVFHPEMRQDTRIERFHASVRSGIALAIVAVAMAVSGHAAHAASPGSMARGAAPGPDKYIAVRRTTLAPFSFAKFCTDNAGQCEVRGSAAPVSLTAAKRDELRRINTAVNREIRYEEDAPGDDVWKIGVTAGDCEDYVLAKRQKLLDAGWPSGALRIAVARTRSGIGHAVLVVTTTEGDMVLDNRSNTIKPWHTVSLKWLKIQSTENPRKWQAL